MREKIIGAEVDDFLAETQQLPSFVQRTTIFQGQVADRMTEELRRF
jgi:hypothetical protein